MPRKLLQSNNNPLQTSNEPHWIEARALIERAEQTGDKLARRAARLAEWMAKYRDRIEKRKARAVKRPLGRPPKRPAGLARVT